MKKKLLIFLTAIIVVVLALTVVACNHSDSKNFDNNPNSTDELEPTEPISNLKYTLNEDDESYSVTGIGTGADTDIVIPSTYNGKPVTSIDSCAFYKRSVRMSITIPDSVTSIGNNAFYKCGGLRRVNISDISAWCEISFGNEYSNPLNYAHNLYLNGELVTDLVIPEGVTSIGSYAFKNCSGLTSIEIPDSVTSIGDYAFSGCSGLRRVNISDISAWCEISFGNEYSNPLNYAHNLYLNGELLTTLKIPEGLTSIGNYAFYKCSGLTSITIGKSMTSIGDRAFYNCSDFSLIDFSGTVEEWQVISKGSDWSIGTKIYTVYCTDGTIANDGTVEYY